ncbi:MAG: hypothetical protein ABIT38_05760 [Gemmatimonadaceae bacterium]
MQRTASSILLISCLSAIAACGVERPIAPADASLVPVRVSLKSAPAGFVTSEPAQAEALVPQAEVKPIISSGDLLPGSNEPWAPIPDGLGAYLDAGKLTVFANHEITAWA